MNPMKRMIVLLAAVFFVTSMNNAKAEKTEWKEMKHFHIIMAKTFHPSEKDDLKPLKENAGKLTASAKEWAASTIPDGYNKELTPKILSKLVTKCEDIENSVKSGASDKVLKKKIAAAHEVFHEIAEKCMPGKDAHGHDHHDGHKH